MANTVISFRWNDHQSTLIGMFENLRQTEALVDCTLAAEGKCLKAHKVILSACSPYFAALLQVQGDEHPIFMIEDVKYQVLLELMDYMYRGEVNVSQDQLDAFLQAAVSLQIRGLSEPQFIQHLRAGYTLPQTGKRARLDSCGTMEAPGDESGSGEDSSSPSRRRRKVRNRSLENGAHESSDATAQPIRQQQQTGDAINNESVQPQSQGAQGAEGAASGGANPSALGAGASTGAVVDPNHIAGSETMAADMHPLEQGQGAINSNRTLASGQQIGLSGEADYECRQCGNKYRRKDSLRRHKYSACGGKEPSHQCPYCPHKTRQIGNLRSHMRHLHTTMPQLPLQRRRFISPQSGP